MKTSKVTLTDEQKAEYQRKVQERPDEYSFNPMHPNDYWVYEIDPPFPGGPIGYGYFSMIADTLINGIPHFKARRPGTDDIHWIKNDGDYVFLFDTDDFDYNPTTEYLMIENFSSNAWLSDTLYWCLGTGAPYEQIPVVIGESYYLSIWGDIVESKTCMYLGPYWSATLVWVRKYGILFSECEFTTMRLIGAYIDGQCYGTVAVDENVNQPNDLLTTKCYPNPFKHNLTITYDTSHIKGAHCYISIYNIKGQLILKENLDDSGIFTWNGKDINSNPVSSGIYFYQIKGNSISSKNTKVLQIK
jgi:hypothetical protein